MAKIKFLHCADIHLEVPFTSLDSGTEKSSVRRMDIKDTFKKIITTAKNEEVNLLFISGDLYEHNYIKKATINFLNDEFKTIPDIKVFIIPGNHDPYIRNSFYMDFKWNSNVHILTEDNPYCILEDLETYVYGMGFKSFSQEKTLVYGLKPIDAGFINVLLVHGTVDMDFKQDIYNPMTSENLKKIGMDYIALGHFHNRLEDIGSHGMIYNPGSPEPLGFDETGEHGVFIGTLEKDKSGLKNLDMRFVSINRRYYEKADIGVDGCNNDEQVISRIEDFFKARDPKDGLFLFTLKGYVDKDFKINTSIITFHFREKTFFMRVKDETSIDYDYEKIMNEPGLRGLFTKKIFSMISKTDDAYEKRQLMQALHFGIEALENGKVEIN